MEWILFWLVLSVVVGVAANSRGRSGFGWFLLAVLISPILAVLFLIAFPQRGARQRGGLWAENHPKNPNWPGKPATSGQLPDSRGRIEPPPATKICPRCAEEVKAAAQVCRFCGHEFAEEASGRTTKSCPRCSHFVPANALVCPNCAFDFPRAPGSDVVQARTSPAPEERGS